MQTPDQNRMSTPELLHLRGSRPLFDEELRTRLSGIKPKPAVDPAQPKALNE